MNRIFVMGDIHGDFRHVRSLYDFLIDKPDSTDTLILLGDMGGNFFLDYRDNNFKKKLGRYGFTYFVVRGNHEQRPSILAEEFSEKWEEEEFFENKVFIEKEYPYIKYACDHPATYFIKGLRTFIFPGAYSVDKFYRMKMGWSWFESEQLTPEEMETGRRMIKLQDNKCDLVLSHTCPVIYEPTDLFIKNLDQSMVDKSMERYLGEIEKDLTYKLWLWGHYHANRIYPKVDNSDKIMIFNDMYLDLDKYIETKDPYASMIKIHFNSGGLI